MRLYTTIIFLSFPLSVLATPPFCDSSDFPAAGGIVNCTTLTIESPVNFVPNPSAAAIEFIVSGDVVINADININGQDGVHYTDDTNSPDITGGPGASEGGGLIAAQGQDGSDFSAEDGKSHVNNGLCNHGGGGGGGFINPGQDGTRCLSGPLPVGAGGSTAGFPAIFRGGYGGGAGGAFPIGGGFYDTGAGGGGGGALHIQSTTGTITVKSGVTISARGGKGGNAMNLGGAGGGGSGGVIWFETLFPVNNKGIFDVRGGEGGVNTNGTNAKGGRGGDGVFRLEIAGVITDATGLSSFAVFKPSLKSNISCGSVLKKEENVQLFKQTVIGFAFAFLIMGLFRILCRIPKIALKMFAFRN